MKHQIRIHLLLLIKIIQLFKIICCQQHNEIRGSLPLTIFFSSSFVEFDRYEKYFKYLNNIISIICDSDNSHAGHAFKSQLFDKYNDRFEMAASEDLDKLFMYQKRLNLTLKSNVKEDWIITIPKHLYYDSYKRMIQRVTLQVNKLKKHPFDVLLLSSRYHQDDVNQSDKSRLLEELYIRTREIIEELEDPTIIILSDFFFIGFFPALLTTSFGRSGANWTICSHDDGISVLFDAIMFYAHSIPPYSLEIHITDCKNLNTLVQLADIVVTYKIKETTKTTTIASTTSRTRTKVTTSASTTSRTTTKVTTSVLTTSRSTNKSTSTKSKTTSPFTTIRPTTITEIILNSQTATLDEKFEYRNDIKSNMSTVLENEELEDDYINDNKCKKISENVAVGNASGVETANVVKVAFGIITCIFLCFKIRK